MTHEAGLRRSLLSEMAMRWTVSLAFLRVVFRPSCPARINRREPAGGRPDDERCTRLEIGDAGQDTDYQRDLEPAGVGPGRADRPAC